MHYILLIQLHLAIVRDLDIELVYHTQTNALLEIPTHLGIDKSEIQDSFYIICCSVLGT